MISKGFDRKPTTPRKNSRYDAKDHDHPGHHVFVAVAIEPRDDARENDQNPFPKQQRAFECAPQTGDAIIDRRGASRVEGDVFDGKVGGDQTVDQSGGGQRDQNELRENRVTRD